MLKKLALEDLETMFTNRPPRSTHSNCSTAETFVNNMESLQILLEESREQLNRVNGKLQYESRLLHQLDPTQPEVVVPGLVEGVAMQGEELGERLKQVHDLASYKCLLQESASVRVDLEWSRAASGREPMQTSTLKQDQRDIESDVVVLNSSLPLSTDVSPSAHVTSSTTLVGAEIGYEGLVKYLKEHVVDDVDFIRSVIHASARTNSGGDAYEAIGNVLSPCKDVLDISVLVDTSQNTPLGLSVQTACFHVAKAGSTNHGTTIRLDATTHYLLYSQDSQLASVKATFQQTFGVDEQEDIIREDRPPVEEGFLGDLVVMKYCDKGSVLLQVDLKEGVVTGEVEEVVVEVGKEEKKELDLS